MSRIRNEALILKVSSNVDPQVWDEGKYDAFVDALCEGREYQKEAIFTALRFLVGGKYGDLRSLARENFDENPDLAEAYGSWAAMERRLQLPDLLACSLDLATGTGKSYVLYGIAAILLAENTVDRVLTLCPSNTIERGLTDKFRALAANSDLQEAMPQDAEYLSPRIINASESITDGCICVENYHAVLKHVKSSIRKSLCGEGERTLVLNDEAHHVASASTDLRKWKEFLLDEEFGFRRVLGVSGTCYVKNDYFADVVCRYSLRQAIEERQVKDVEYVAEEARLRDPDEKWQVIHSIHKKCFRKIRRRFKSIRPLTIVVTRNIKGCNEVAEDLRAFLQEHEGVSEEQAAGKVLVVTSARAHERNVALLRMVDSPSSKVEWIISVSMLTEGWDVKNVFQIVPHEERAFNSKLLIAQVLGRGLRVPAGWQGEQPVVTVFNHESWAPRIEHLVNEILDMEKRVSSVILKHSEYHFVLHNLDYEKDKTTAQTAAVTELNLFERGYLDLPTLPAEESVQVRYERVRGKGRKETLNIRHKTFTMAEIAKAMHENLAAIDRETASDPNPEKRTRYAVRHSEDWLLQVVRETVRRSAMNEDEIPDEARQKFLRALGALRRKESKRVAYRQWANALLKLETRERQNDSCSAAELQRDKAIFYRSGCEKYIPEEQKDFFHELQDVDGAYSGRAIPADNDYNFKTPVNLVIADSEPERRFIRQLCEGENAKVLDAWLKNTAMGFYAVEYAWSKPTTRSRGGAPHVKRGMFSPDFFIKQDGNIFVVEIKDDSEVNEPSPENIKKHEFASKHFQRLNEWLSKEAENHCYHFNMLTPQDYGVFFDCLRQRRAEGYRSRLDAAILESSDVPGSATQFDELDVVKLSTDAYQKEGLKRGERGTIVLVHSTNGGKSYEVEFEHWEKEWPFKTRTFKGDEIEKVEKWEER